MPTTTNFGWTTPADTDLVKDGAAAIRTFAGNVDTSLVDLKGGTSGQYLTKNSNTDLDYAWVTLSAGGMTLISTTTLTGASVTLSTIPSTFVNLYLVIQNFLPATDDDRLRCRINADSTGNRHYSMQLDGDVSGNGPKSFDDTSFRISSDNDNAVASGISTITFPNYTNTTTWKYAKVESIGVGNVTTTQFIPANYFGVYNQTSAISSLVLFAESGNMTSGTALLYGVK